MISMRLHQQIAFSLRSEWMNESADRSKAKHFQPIETCVFFVFKNDTRKPIECTLPINTSVRLAKSP